MNPLMCGTSHINLEFKKIASVDYNNYKTSMVTISSKRIEFSGTPIPQVGQTYSLGMMQG